MKSFLEIQLMRTAETIMQTKFDIDREKSTLYQIIRFDGNSKYLFDPALIINRKIENKIIESNISNNKTIFFKDMIRKENQVILEYKITSDFNDNILKPTYQKIIADLPDNRGCYYCVYRVYKNNIKYCTYQDNKILTVEKKDCRFFSQKKLNKS